MAGTSTQTIGQKDYGDYISLLPDCLIHHIFSFLPTRDVVKTCVLSKRWRSVWTTVSDLEFPVYCYADFRFVDRVLELYVGFKVKKFHIRSNILDSSDLDSWVPFAIKHQVEDLLLNLDVGDDLVCNKLWSPLLNNCSSLTKLCLRGCSLSSDESINWSSLKSLSIQNVSGNVLQKILMGSPVLEYLNLINCWCTQIHSRSLRELVIDGDVMSSLNISTPHLLSLCVRGDYCREIIRIIEAPSLVEVELDFDGPVKSDFCLLKEMLCKLQNATRILFGAWCLRVMWARKVEDVQVSLPNCRSLTLHVCVPQFSFPAIANMLATTPNLEKLVIIFEPPNSGMFWYKSDLDSRNVDHKSYWHIQKKLKCWARHLKNVEIFGFYACLRVHNEELPLLVQFLLGHASVLETMFIKVKNYKSQRDIEVVDLCKLDEVGLKYYIRASKA